LSEPLTARHRTAPLYFPTRRSSDLGGRASPPDRRLRCKRGQPPARAGARPPRRRDPQRLLSPTFRPRLEESELLNVARARSRHQDRKSTRLNSSHVKISYAVFCLKN